MPEPASSGFLYAVDGVAPTIHPTAWVAPTAVLIGDVRLAAGANIWFAWAGGTEHLQPNYYRVQTADFLVEFDKTQSNGNHIHSVWRDLNNDFGRDLLKEHYAASHTAAK